MTPRQQLLLSAIISEFIDSATAVGSLSLTDKYRFKVSPATIRNEMATLVDEGYLDKPHSSSGRVPTTMGLRYFIEELMGEYVEPDIISQEELKTQLHAIRFQQESLVREALKYLSKISGNATIALVDKDVYYAGLSEMLSIPEFQHLDNLRTLMSVLEDYAVLAQIFNRSQSDGEVKVLIGDETGVETFQNYAVVFANLQMHGGKSGYIAVIGPNRMHYNRIIPVVKFVASTLNRLTSGW